VFIVAQVLDEAGNPVQFDKKRLKVVSVEVSAEKVLEKVEGGELDSAFYVRLIVPPRQAQLPARAAQVEAHNARTA
jgi:hypothetical protein